MVLGWMPSKSLNKISSKIKHSLKNSIRIFLDYSADIYSLAECPMP